mgnify:CR=1 FL=1
MSFRRLIASAAVLAIWALTSALHAQTPPPAAPTTDYFDVSADRSELKKINGETVLELLRSV